MKKLQTTKQNQNQNQNQTRKRRRRKETKLTRKPRMKEKKRNLTEMMRTTR